MSRLPDILKRILDRKREEIAERSAKFPLGDLRARCADAAPAREFSNALRAKVAGGECGVIAEIKRASPSKGLLRDPFDPAQIAESYARNGAACLSIVTDRDFFRGDDDFLVAARDASRLPVLRKDFVIAPYQVYESRVLGADCILLIVAALDDRQLAELADCAVTLGLDVLVEVHDGAELERALGLNTPLLGINNRDLRDFRVNLETTSTLAPRVPPDRLVVTESGINTREQVQAMCRQGIHCFLVGEAFMRASDPGARLADLFSSN